MILSSHLLTFHRLLHIFRIEKRKHPNSSNLVSRRKSSLESSRSYLTKLEIGWRGRSLRQEVGAGAGLRPKATNDDDDWLKRSASSFVFPSPSSSVSKPCILVFYYSNHSSQALARISDVVSLGGRVERRTISLN